MMHIDNWFFFVRIKLSNVNIHFHIWKCYVMFFHTIIGEMCDYIFLQKMLFLFDRNINQNIKLLFTYFIFGFYGEFLRFVVLNILAD